MKSNQITYIRRRTLVFLLILTLLIGILPVGPAPVSKAKETFASAANASRSGYGLSNPSTTSDGVTTWDCVYFGNYPQSDATGATKEPIKWRVLSVNGDDAFLLADKNLDVQRYNDTQIDVTWETCTMRTWLNSTFLNKAFNASEQAAIQDTLVVNEDNMEYGIEGGSSTIDKIYLLSLGEAMNPSYGFISTTDSTATREAVNTAYVAAGGEIKSDYMTLAGSTDWWCLRSPGIDSSAVSSVDIIGYVSQYGYGVDTCNVAVRPALHLNLNASSDAISVSVWSYASTVSAAEEKHEIPEPNPPVTSAPDTILVPSATENPSAEQNPVVMPSPAPASPQTTQNVQPQATATPESAVSKTVTPGKVTGLKLTAKKKAIQVSWKKVSGASGYELWYSTSKKFTKKKSKTTKKTKLTIKNLKQKKVYFVKVRAYTVRDGEKVYGAWSKTVKKKVK